MEFEWDEAKRHSDWRKHRVDFRQAARVFLDPFVLTFDDDTDADEVRSNAIGVVDDRLLFVTYTMRGDACRIISARRAVSHEKRRYHEV